MRSSRLVFVVLFLICTLWAAPGSDKTSDSWQPIGPFGGDARSLTADPSDFHRLFAGTSNSQIYFSSDGGHQWSRLSEISSRTDLIVGHILIHPGDRNLMYASAYTTNDGDGGGVFRSTNAGKTWKEMPDMLGQSVRALTMAPGDPRTLAAGSLEGVFRSTDAGDHWQRISPEHHAEIRNVESVAIDPSDARVIYAGTWHLPWKTSDGGTTWYSIKTGIIDDSDVFTITVDWSNRNTAYLGACSGIYRTETAGMQWHKVQGIPFAARRTRAIRQDPRVSSVVYAGTTEGLWKTDNGGAGWTLQTPPGLIVNDVAIDPGDSSHVLLATDRAGILESHDGAHTFFDANRGFSHRQIWRLLAGSSEMIATVRHDKEYGGIFVSTDGLSSDGVDWRGISASGLAGNDVLSIARLSNGDLLAGASGGGLYRYTSVKDKWETTGKALRPVKLASGRTGMVGMPLSAEVVDLASTGGVLYAATPDGVLRSNDDGATWLAMSPKWDVAHLRASPELLVASMEFGLRISRDSGVTWKPGALPESAATNGLAVSGSRVWVATQHGLYRSLNASSDAGALWERQGRGIPFGPVFDVAIDPENPKRVFAGSAVNNRIYASRDGGESYDELPQDGFSGSRPRRLAVGPKGRLYLASGYDGLFLRSP